MKFFSGIVQALDEVSPAFIVIGLIGAGMLSVGGIFWILDVLATIFGVYGSFIILGLLLLVVPLIYGI